jgi:hypothetical protein
MSAEGTSEIVSKALLEAINGFGSVVQLVKYGGDTEKDGICYEPLKPQRFGSH